MTSLGASASPKTNERYVWELLVRDFLWNPPPDSDVFILDRKSLSPSGGAKFQLFEVLFATLLSKLLPTYRWEVSPNQPDSGTDFIGRTSFLRSEALGISAFITVGGQCKKRERVDDIVGTVSGSLARMLCVENPTFFVVALSANLKRERLRSAQAILQQAHQRDCHIIERRQIEGLMLAHLKALLPLIRTALLPHEGEIVISYLKNRSKHCPVYELSASSPERVLAGEPFDVVVDIGLTFLSDKQIRLRWHPIDSVLASDGIQFIGPVGADRSKGILVDEEKWGRGNDPLSSQVRLLFVSYSVGTRSLGVLELISESGDTFVVLEQLALEPMRVVENMRPRFFDTPVRDILISLESSWRISEAGSIETVTVVGSGGAGKSRVTEEFALEVRRRGGAVVTAKQANTLDYPWRLFANLLIALADPNHNSSDLAEAVLSKIALYDAKLSSSASKTVRDIVGSAGKCIGVTDDQTLISVVLLLIRATTRNCTLLLHLQDLHWCTLDVLKLIEVILWQLESLRGVGVDENGSRQNGVLVVLEGRVGEEFGVGNGRWSTHAFEAVANRIAKPMLHCKPFSPEQSEEFTRRLFEQPHSSRPVSRVVSFDVQNSIVVEIQRAASGNPFHILEQLKLLKARGVVACNPDTGLYYVIRPSATGKTLPATVSESILARWRYIRSTKPPLAHLIWATALLSERIPRSLFQRLLTSIAPNFGLEEIESTEFIHIPDNDSSPISLRHENYFQTLRQLDLPLRERKKAIKVYVSWYEAIVEPTAQQLYDLARIHLATQTPDMQQVAALLCTSKMQSVTAGDTRLYRRVLGTLIDEVYLPRFDLFLTDGSAFNHFSEDEISLCRTMVMLGERNEALHRLARMDEQITERMRHSQDISGSDDDLRVRRFFLRVLYIRTLMNSQQPAQAVEMANVAISEFDARRRLGLDVSAPQWCQVEMELCHAHAVALALAGDIDGSLVTAHRSVVLAREADVSLETAVDVISTYANILLARDPFESERVLRDLSAKVSALPETGRAAIHFTINLAMCTIVIAQQGKTDTSTHRDQRTDEAFNALKKLYSSTIYLGRFSEAAATALLIGLIYAQRRDDADSDWFAESVNAANRARNSETLWRAHINLASSLHRQFQGKCKKGDKEMQLVRQHAYAAYEILAATLSPYACPEQSHRFAMVRIPLAHAIRFLVAAGDIKGEQALSRFPTIQDCFEDISHGWLRADRGGFESHEWLRDGEYDYVLY